jgi:hypothetical protein
MLSSSVTPRAHLGRRGAKFLAEHAALPRGLAADDLDRFEQSLSGLQRHHQQIEDGRQFVQDGLSPLLSEALDHMVRQQVASQCATQ